MYALKGFPFRTQLSFTKSCSRSLMKVGALSALKRRLVPGGVQARRVPFGLYRGLVLELDLKDRTQL